MVDHITADRRTTRQQMCDLEYMRGRVCFGTVPEDDHNTNTMRRNDADTHFCFHYNCEGACGLYAAARFPFMLHTLDKYINVVVCQSTGTYLSQLPVRSRANQKVAGSVNWVLSRQIDADVADVRLWRF